MTTVRNAADYLGPTSKDTEYTQNDQLAIGLICRTDSYKFSHPFAYPEEVKGMSSYGEARVSRKTEIIPFGLQIFLKKFLTQRITAAHIDEAEAFALAHFGRPLFAREAWEKVVNVYGGYLPLIIRAAPEGTVLSGGLPIYSVTCLDEDLAWMSSGIETAILRAVWYPTTIATMDYQIKRKIKHYYEVTGSDLAMLPFSLHDFGGRGVTSAEQAEIGGAAHTVNFMGSDTVEGVLAANFYYKTPMAAFSVFATEHSVECSFGGGREDAIRYIRQVLKNAPEGSIVSFVLDGYDVYREAELACTVLHDEIIATKAKIVFRPDSGDMMEVVPRILALQARAFGTVKNAKGFLKVNNVGILQGYGIDHLAITMLLDRLITMGFSADNLVFGSGGALLQKVNRDTLKFAQKASAILVDGDWKGIAKDPITDPGKKSKEGIMTTVRSRMTGELMAARLDTGPINEEFEDVHVLVYNCGKLYNETTLDEVRARCA